MQINMRARHYRPDIDGLRAIAVLSVFLHHLNASFLPGGFIGVDIFFVISGYLITGQISAEIQEGNFSIRQFYQRRINRIVPALVTVVFVTILIGLILLSPDDMTLLARSAAYAIFGTSNFFFWDEYGNYFAANATEAPLLHTWSLGVEEQFYIIWPLLLILSFRWLNRYKIGILILLFVSALMVSEMGVRVTASAAYYLLPTRFFELMIGGLLALPGHRIAPRSTKQSAYIFVIGLLLVLSSMLWIDKASPFPGILALWPCIGALFIIWSGLQPCSVDRVITNRVMVFIGLISYSMYLWHWPVIAFLKYLNIDISLFVGLVIFGSTLWLSWLSWKFVENPLRRSGSDMPFLSVISRRFVFPAATLLALSIAAVLGQGFPGRFDPEVGRLEASQKIKPNELRAGCHVPTAQYATPPLDRCRLGMNTLRTDGILIGDSFANHFSGMLDVIAGRDGLSFMDYTMDGCPPIMEYDNGKGPAYAERCRLRNEAAYSYIEQQHFNYVVLASNWPDSTAAYSLLSKSLKRLLATGGQIILILKNESIKDANTCVIRNAMYDRRNECRQRPHGQPAYFTDLRSQFPSIRFIDPNSIICNVDGCDPVLDGVLMYRDSVHLNDLGSRLIGEKLLATGFTLVASEEFISQLAPSAK